MPVHRRQLLVMSMLLAGASLVIGHWLSVDSDQSTAGFISDFAAHRARGIAGGLLLSVGAFLLLPTVVGALQVVRARGARLATVGAVVAAIGAIALGAGDVMITLVVGTLVKSDPGLARSVVGIAEDSGLAGLPFQFAPALFLGFILLAIAMLRARSVTRWVPILLIVGVVCIGAFSTGGGLRAGIATLPFGVAVAALGVQLRQAPGAVEPSVRSS
jgi:hypothetical protein